MSDKDLPDTLTASVPQPWGRLVPCLKSLNPMDFYKESIKIGRAVTCDVVINDSLENADGPTGTIISKEHSLLTKESDDEFYITDLSKNGTFLNGNNIGKHQKAALKNNDKIGCCKADFFIFQHSVQPDLPDTLTASGGSSVLSLTPRAIFPMWGILTGCILHIQSYELKNLTFKVGRSSFCDAVIGKMEIDPRIKKQFSKEHFIIVKDPESSITYITDLSRTGTYLNGRLIGRNFKNILQHNDIISIGLKKQKVYAYKSMCPSEAQHLPEELRQKYAPCGVIGKGACGEVKLAYEKCVRMRRAHKLKMFCYQGRPSDEPQPVNERLPIRNSFRFVIYGQKYPRMQNFMKIGHVSKCSNFAFISITCQKYAIKNIIKSRSTTSEMCRINHPTKIRTEINILKALSHPFIIRMEDIVETPTEVFIVLEYMQGGELRNRILSIRPLTESNVKFFFYQMALAVNYLHSNGIAHRDLKPENVLLSSDEPETLLKVSDFGLSKITEDDDMMRTMCGTWSYIAPEILDTCIKNYNKQVDVWSLGVILFYMLSKQLPFSMSDKAMGSFLIKKGIYEMEEEAWQGISFQAKDLVRKMLTVDPQERITISGILNHPWLEKDVPMQYRVKSLLNGCDSQDATITCSMEPPTKRVRLSSDESE